MDAQPFSKQDRIIRLLRLLRLITGRPYGWTTRELAERLEVSQRTVQRDIMALETDLHVPLVVDGGRYTVDPAFHLEPIVLNLHEAMALLIGARLMLRFADKANHFAANAYEKVATKLPFPMREHVLEAADLLLRRHEDRDYLRHLTALTTAWAERRKVALTYATQPESPRVVWPLFIEPTISGHGLYLIAWDQRLRQPRNFKLERIREIRVLEERYEPPRDFSLREYLAHAWGIWVSEKPVEVELRFAPSAAERVKETIWQQGQELEEEPDGSLILRLVVAEPTELRHWVLGWGAACEVVSPESFRDAVASELARAVGRYGFRLPAESSS
jgi:predicted DNA-binding transcriptional regulator YafY